MRVLRALEPDRECHKPGFPGRSGWSRAGNDLSKVQTGSQWSIDFMCTGYIFGHTAWVPFQLCPSHRWDHENQMRNDCVWQLVTFSGFYSTASHVASFRLDCQLCWMTWMTLILFSVAGCCLFFALIFFHRVLLLAPAQVPGLQIPAHDQKPNAAYFESSYVPKATTPIQLHCTCRVRITTISNLLEKEYSLWSSNVEVESKWKWNLLYLNKALGGYR